jgi:hypothetical protein
MSEKNKQFKEVIKAYDVVQSRGVCNTNTEWHNEIVNLVRSNMHLIRGVA